MLVHRTDDAYMIEVLGETRQIKRLDTPTQTLWVGRDLDIIAIEGQPCVAYPLVQCCHLEDRAQADGTLIRTQCENFTLAQKLCPDHEEQARSRAAERHAEAMAAQRRRPSPGLGPSLFSEEELEKLRQELDFS